MHWGGGRNRGFFALARSRRSGAMSPPAAQTGSRARDGAPAADPFPGCRRRARPHDHAKERLNASMTVGRCGQGAAPAGAEGACARQDFARLRLLCLVKSRQERIGRAFHGIELLPPLLLH